MKPEFWYDLWYGNDGNVWGALVPPHMRARPSEKRGFTRFSGKNFTLYVRTRESAAETKKMAFTWGVGLLHDKMESINLNED